MSESQVSQTCSSKTGMAVDSQLPLLDSKGHDFHHVQDCCQGCYTIILPPKVVVINWKTHSQRNSEHFKISWGSTYRCLLLLLVWPSRCNILLGNSGSWPSCGSHLTQTPLLIKHTPNAPSQLNDIGRQTGQCVLPQHKDCYRNSLRKLTMGKCPRSKCDLATVHGVGQSMDASRECCWHEVYFVRNDVGRFYGLKDIQMKAGTQGFPLEHCVRPGLSNEWMQTCTMKAYSKITSHCLSWRRFMC